MTNEKNFTVFPRELQNGIVDRNKPSKVGTIKLGWIDSTAVYLTQELLSNEIWASNLMFNVCQFVYKMSLLKLLCKMLLYNC